MGPRFLAQPVGEVLWRGLQPINSVWINFCSAGPPSLKYLHVLFCKIVWVLVNKGQLVLNCYVPGDVPVRIEYKVGHLATENRGAAARLAQRLIFPHLL